MVGDSADDHALAMLCDRVFTLGAWVPARLLAGESPYRIEALNALRVLQQLPSTPVRPILLVSTTESIESLQVLADELDGEPVIMARFDAEPARRATPRRPFRAVALSTLTPSRGWKLISSDLPDRALGQPTARIGDGIDLLTPVDPPMPGITAELGQEISWVIDVSLNGHQPPARTGLPVSSLTAFSGASSFTSCRASRDGISYLSTNFGLSVPGNRHARPLLRFPDAEQIFHDLAAAEGVTIERSDAGRRAANAADLWGSLPAMAADLRGPVRRALDLFLPPKGKKDGDYTRGYAIRGGGFVALEDITDHAGFDKIQARALADRLTQLKVLRRGFLLNCERCRYEAFYLPGHVGQNFTCQGCDHVSPLAFGRWYTEDPEPHWYYRLDHVVRNLLAQHGDVPVLAVHGLADRSQSLLWCPEIVLRGEGFEAELDICSVINGEIHVGEGKSNNSLKGDLTLEKAASKLVRAARITTADVIVLATSQDGWARGNREAVEAALDEQWTIGPRPRVLEMVRVGVDPPDETAKRHPQAEDVAAGGGRSTSAGTG
ncbi:hypothetical protein AB0368_05635 [Actinoplanes sp. NPDC051475]|uniref:hypothetical protein n=1 Tax=Actinoplanes sp. NPDC051475 TaxID=3157225 RepID=UPI00344C3E43